MRGQSGGTPHLVVLAPESKQGRRIALAKDYLVVGRKQTCDAASMTWETAGVRGIRLAGTWRLQQLRSICPAACLPSRVSLEWEGP